MANQTARVDVADAEMMGTTGAQDRDTKQRILVARLKREAAVEENEQNQAIQQSQAKLAVVTAEAKKVEEIAFIEAELSAEVSLHFFSALLSVPLVIHALC